MDPPVETQERLRIEAAQRDPSEFAVLYEEHFDRVYAFVARRVRDRSLAEDLTAGVFEHALSALPRYEWRGVPFAAWLYRIAANAVADHLGSARRERETTRPEAQPGEDEVVAAERRALLFRYVRELPSDQRSVIEARFGQERSIRQIAQEMGRSEGAVKQLQWRALQTLRQRLGPHV